MENQESERLTNRQITDIAEEISLHRMTKIAYKYFKLNEGMLENIKLNSPGDAEAQSREMLRRWANKNSKQQVQVRPFSSSF